MPEQLLNGAVAMVTDASSGVGAATARRLARVGAAIALVTRTNHPLDQLAADVTDEGGTVVVVEADITDPVRADQAVQETVDRFDRLDVLVNNAGLVVFGTALHSTIEEWEQAIALNIGATLYVTHAAVPFLIDAAATSPRRVADIVNVAATAGPVNGPGCSVYNLTKLGLGGFTESLRQELVIERVRVSLVEAGAVSTDLGVEPLRPDDIADLITFVVTRERNLALNHIVARAGDQTS